VHVSRHDITNQTHEPGTWSAALQPALAVVPSERLAPSTAASPMDAGTHS